MNGSLSIRAHFDGRFIVPDEPVDLPLDAPLKVDVWPATNVSAEATVIRSVLKDSRSVAQRLAGFGEFTTRLGHRPPSRGIPVEALRREHMYGDEGR